MLVLVMTSETAAYSIRVGLPTLETQPENSKAASQADKTFLNEYRQFSADLAPSYRTREKELFDSNDPLGRTWFQLSQELYTMLNGDLDMLPLHVELGFYTATEMLGGLWLVTQEYRDSPGSGEAYSPDYIDEVRELLQVYEPYRDYFELMCIGNRDLRMMVGQTMTYVGEIGKNTYCKEDPHLAEFIRGGELALYKWKVLSCDC